MNPIYLLQQVSHPTCSVTLEQHRPGFCAPVGKASPVSYPLLTKPSLRSATIVIADKKLRVTVQIQCI